MSEKRKAEDKASLLERIERGVKLIRDIGLILGIPIAIGIGSKLYTLQIEALQAENEALKMLRYDNALEVIESQKELYILDTERKNREIAEKELDIIEKAATITRLKESSATTHQRLQERCSVPVGMRSVAEVNDCIVLHLKLETQQNLVILGAEQIRKNLEELQANIREQLRKKG